MDFVLRVRGLVNSCCVLPTTRRQDTSAVINYANLCLFFSFKESMALSQVRWKCLCLNREG